MTDLLFFSSLAFVSAASVLTGLASVSSYALTKRRQQYVSARRLAAEHADAMELLCKDNRTPSIIKSAVVDLSEIYDNEEAMQGIAQGFLRENASGSSGSISKDLSEAIHWLSSAHPDLWSHFVTAFRSGVMAAFLRWPSTAALADDLALILAGKSEERELAAFTRKASDRPEPEYQGQLAHA